MVHVDRGLAPLAPDLVLGLPRRIVQVERPPQGLDDLVVPELGFGERKLQLLARLQREVVAHRSLDPLFPSTRHPWSVRRIPGPAKHSVIGWAVRKRPVTTSYRCLTLGCEGQETDR